MECQFPSASDRKHADLERRGEERRGEERKASFGSYKGPSHFAWWIRLFPFISMSGFLSGTYTPTHSLKETEEMFEHTAHQPGINNSVILHCIYVYVSLVAERRSRLRAILRPGALCKTSHRRTTGKSTGSNVSEVLKE